MIDRLDLNTKAQELRELLGEDANSPVDIFALAQQIDGLTIVFCPMGKNISGMCIREKGVKLIAVNSSMSYGRQRFSLAHELYHLYYDESRGYYVCAKNFDLKNELEKSADQFATYFLAPYKAFRDAVRRICPGRKLKMGDIIALEQYFGISHQAMLWRLLSEGMLTREESNRLTAGVTAGARMLGFDDRLYRPLPENMQKRTYGHYIKQVEALRERERVSGGKLDELLLEAFRDDIVFGEDEEPGGDAVD